MIYLDTAAPCPVDEYGRHTRLELLGILRDIARWGGIDTGICGAVQHRAKLRVGWGASLGSITGLASDLMRCWPERSCNPVFPVEGDATTYHTLWRYRWDRNSLVGSRRWELLEWMIKQLEDSLNDAPSLDKPA